MIKCVICDKEANYIVHGFSQCKECLMDEHNMGCYNLTKFPIKLDDFCYHNNTVMPPKPIIDKEK